MGQAGNIITDANETSKEVHCTCSDHSAGLMDASLLFCMKGGEVCSNETDVTASKKGSFGISPWLFFALLLMFSGFIVVGVAYSSGYTPNAKNKRDIDFSPGGSSIYDEEDSDEE